MKELNLIRRLRLGMASMLIVTTGLCAQKPNVLFIAFDDLRTELGCYGKAEVISPNIDKLAAEGVLFERAYCQMAVCNPSRASLMTGRRPDTTCVYDLHTHFRKALPDVVTLPQHFKNHGYHTLSFGKLYHGAFEIRSAMNDKPSWSVPAWFPQPRYYFTEQGSREARDIFARRKQGAKKINPDDWVNYFVPARSWEAPDVADDVLQDGHIAAMGVKTLRELARKDQPFFLALGFLKPHLPFIAPKKYWDLYKRENIKLAENPYHPKGMPALAGNRSGELGMYFDLRGQTPLSDDKARELIHGYRACVSFLDAQVGLIINELEKLELRDNTVIVLWSDHGFKLGEHAMWCKQTNFELDTRVPLIIAAPGYPKGVRIKALCELVDLYPTISELCGLPTPKDVEGTSCVPLLRNPDHPWKRAAFSQYPRPGKIMGYSMRTDRWRYTRWINRTTKKTVAVELYDHQSDPDENVNVAKKQANREVLNKLATMMDADWSAAQPAQK